MMCTSVYLLCVLVANYYTTFVISQQVCLSDECRNASQLIQNNLNTSVDPCVDMFQFACGGWTQNNEIPEGESEITPFKLLENKIQKQVIEILKEDGWVFKGRSSTAVRKIKQFYKSCIDVETIEEKGADPLKKLIDEYGSWTVTPTNNSWDGKTWRLQEALPRAHKLTGDSFWRVAIALDEKNTSRNILYVYQSGLTLPEHFFEYDSPSVRDRFMNIALTIGHLLDGSNETVMDKMNKVYNLEKALSQIFDPRWDPYRMYNLMNLSQFQNLIGTWMDVEEYFREIVGNVDLTSDYQIVVQAVDYFSKLQQVIESTDDEVLANYIMWNLILPTLNFLPDDFSADKMFDTNKMEEINEIQRRQMICWRLSNIVMPTVNSALYVDRHYSQELNVKIVTALDDIEREFIKNLNQLSWLDDVTKRNLKEKVEAMTSLVGYPDWILDPIKLDAQYEDLVIEEGEHFENILKFVEIKLKNYKRKLQLPPEKNGGWYKYAHNVDAYYNKYVNKVIVLAGLLQEPIFSKDYPKSYLYGALGAILSHEIVHVFDSTGRHYDKDGNLRDIWTPHVAEEFDRRAQCFIDQYNRYEVHGQNISGINTLGENIADNGGVKMAYRAYKSSIGSSDFTLPGLNLTNDQLFFVGFSSNLCSKYTEKESIWIIHHAAYSHGEFRNIGTVSNSKEFSKAFNCPVNSPMNPENKCEVW